MAKSRIWRLRVLTVLGLLVLMGPQTAALAGDAKLGKGNSLRLRGPLGQEIELRQGADFQVMGLSGSGKASAPLVFAGYGATAPKANYDDFKGINVAGKVVVLLRRTPRWSNEYLPFDGDKKISHAELQNKQALAIANKAAAVILVNDRTEEGDKLLAFGFLAELGGPGAIPAVQVRRAVIDMVLQSSLGMDLKEVEQAIDRDLKPRSAVLAGWNVSLQTKVVRKAKAGARDSGSLESLCVALLTGTLQGTAGTGTDSSRAVAKAVGKTAGLKSYAFKIEEKSNQRAGVEGKYEKGQAVFLSADKIDFYKKGEALVYKDAGQWQRSKTGTQSDPLRILGAVSKVRGARLPHEELADLVKGLKAVEKVEAEPKGSTLYAGVYSGTLTEAAAKKLAPPSLRSIVTQGRSKLWVGLDGQVHQYAITIRARGVVGNAEINTEINRTVTLSNLGTARVEVPKEARKVLE
jgi:hypothetical protein